MKNFFKLFWVIALAAVIGFSLTSCDILSSETDDGEEDSGNTGSDGLKPVITVKNNTGYSVYVYIKPSTEVKNWGGNQLYYSWSTLGDGESYDCTLAQPLPDCNVYDFRLSGGGYDFIKYGVNVSNKMTVTFTTSDLNNMSSLPKITIQNRSGKRFDSVSIKPSASPESDWRDFGGIGNNDDNSDITILIPPANYTVFDIQAKSSNPTNTYTKTNVNITNGMTLLFTGADRVNPTIEDPVIVIQNNTGYYVDVRIRPSGSSDWGSNQLYYSWSTLGDGASYAISVSSGLKDIKLNGGGYNFIKSSVIVTDGQVYTFTPGDKSTP